MKATVYQILQKGIRDKKYSKKEKNFEGWIPEKNAGKKRRGDQSILSLFTSVLDISIWEGKRNCYRREHHMVGITEDHNTQSHLLQ